MKLHEKETQPKPEYLLSAIRKLLLSKLPAPVILLMIIELIEHGPGIAQKIIR